MLTDGEVVVTDIDGEVTPVASAAKLVTAARMSDIVSGENGLAVLYRPTDVAAAPSSACGLIAAMGSHFPYTSPFAIKLPIGEANMFVPADIARLAVCLPIRD